MVSRTQVQLSPSFAEFLGLSGGCWSGFRRRKLDCRLVCTPGRAGRIWNEPHKRCRGFLGRVARFATVGSSEPGNGCSAAAAESPPTVTFWASLPAAFRDCKTTPCCERCWRISSKTLKTRTTKRKETKMVNETQKSRHDRCFCAVCFWALPEAASEIAEFSTTPA